MSFQSIFVTGIKKVTHVLAGGIVALAAFSATHAGQALIQQYPVLTGVFVATSAIAALYHKPDAE